MSLFGSIQMAGNTLQAMDVALQVVNQNISNANTTGYIREEAVLQTAGTQQSGNLLLGTGVEVTAVVQKIDKYLEERIRGTTSDSSYVDTLKSNYTQLEGVLNALSNSNDLSTAMNTFFSSISDILNSPDDVTVRNKAVSNGQTLADDITSMFQQVKSLRSDVNDQIKGMANSINQLTDKIGKLNAQISQMQSSTSSNSDAVGLTDQRLAALTDLAKLVNISTTEQTDGTISVYCGGEYLVSEGNSRQVKVTLNSDSYGLNAAKICFVDSGAALKPTSGELRGLIDSRDEVLGGFLNQLNDFAQTLTYEFNKVYSSGQGLNGYTTLTSQYAVDDASKALNDAGLTYTPENGSFQVLVTDTQTGLTTTTTIQIDLNGTSNDTTLADLNDALNNINGISSQILSNGTLKITSDSSDTKISFANDTSGVLASLGLNVFFTGTSAGDIGVSKAVVDDPSLFAASSGGIGADTDNAQILANFVDQKLTSHNNETVGDMYTNIVADTAQKSSTAASNSTAAATYLSSLQSQESSISGVSLDEEAVKLLIYQKVYQASAKLISTISNLLDSLMNITVSSSSV
jgi:flagellar hook-associated protein 1 FlgK